MVSLQFTQHSSAGVSRSRRMMQFGLGFLLPQGSHPASLDLKPSVPVEALLSRGYVDVEVFREWQFSKDDQTACAVP